MKWLEDNDPMYLREYLNDHPEYDNFETIKGILNYMGGEHIFKNDIKISKGDIIGYVIKYKNSNMLSRVETHLTEKELIEEFQKRIQLSNWYIPILREYKLKQLLK